MAQTTAENLKVGDVIMPPAREIQLWMRRELKTRGLPESALHLTITEIREGEADKRGRWLIIKADQTAAWCANYINGPALLTFKARPETAWPKIS